MIRIWETTLRGKRMPTIRRFHGSALELSALLWLPEAADDGI